MKHAVRLSYLAILIFIVALPSHAKEMTPSSTVTLPVEVYREYLELKSEPKIPAVTTLEEIKISGEFSSGVLTFQMRGKSSKKTPAENFLIVPGEIRLSKCKGNVIVYRSKSGFSLLPKAEKFEATCILRFGERDALSLQFGQSVLDARVRVKGAEAIEQSVGKQGMGVLLRKVHRTSAAPSKVDAKISVLPRYRITVKSDEVRFAYQLRLENPNSKSKSFEVPLPNQERISRIETKVPNDWKGEVVTFNLKPGTSTVNISGQLPDNKFEPLFDTEEQYLLLEFHPLVALKLEESPSRIGVEQTGMRPSFDAAMGFLIGKGKRIVWTSKTREVFASESFAAQSAEYIIYIPEKGKSLIDARWQIQNQGKPSLRYELPGQAIFASSDGRPQVLAKTEKNELFLPLRTGNTHLRVQYELASKLPRPLGVWSTSLVKPSTDLPQTMANIRLGSRHKIVAAKLSGNLMFPWAKRASWTWSIFVSILWLLLVPQFGIQRKGLAMVSTLGLFALGSFYPFYATIALLSLFLGILCRYRKRISLWFFSLSGTKKWVSLVTGSLFILLVALIGFASMSMLIKKGSRSSEQLMTQTMTDYQVKEKSIGRRGLGPSPREDADVREQTVKEEESYLGLPVERVIPRGRTTLFLNDNAIPKEMDLSVTIFAISLLTSFSLILVALVGWLGPVFIFRREIKKKVWDLEDLSA